MKRLLSLILCSLLVSMASFANSPFDNELDVENEFADLHQIESYLEANPDVDYATLTTEKQDLMENVNLTDATSILSSTDQMPLLPSFWWGCLLGIIGLALVYFITDNDKDQVKKALIGCVISTLVVGIGGLLGGFGLF